MSDDAQSRKDEGLLSTGSDLDRKYWMALALYGVLAALAWFTLGEGKVLVGRQAGGVAVASADSDWRIGFEDGFGPSGGEDSPRRGEGRLVGRPIEFVRGLM